MMKIPYTNQSITQLKQIMSQMPQLMVGVKIVMTTLIVLNANLLTTWEQNFQ